MKNRYVTLKEAYMLKAQGYNVACNSWYRSSSDNRLFKNQTGFSDNSNRHRLSAPRILDIVKWLPAVRLNPDKRFAPSMLLLPGLYKVQIDTLKNFLSKADNGFRTAYGKRVQEFPRQCIFMETTNDTVIFKKTGNVGFTSSQFLPGIKMIFSEHGSNGPAFRETPINRGITFFDDLEDV